MDITNLKRVITDSSKIDLKFIIFKNSTDSFIADQYINRIANKNQANIEFIDSLDSFYFNDPFRVPEESILYIYRTDTLNLDTEGLLDKNVYIICNKIKSLNSCYSDYVIEVPKLEAWQIKDYIFSNATGLTDTQLDYLYKMCGSNIYRAAIELDKLKIFTKNNRKSVFDSFIAEDQYSDLITDNVFTLSNAVLTKDLTTISRLYTELNALDFNVMGFIQLLYSNFRNIINIQLAKYPTAESCGLKPNQFYALKYKINFYSKEQLLKIFSFLTDIDRQIKTGTLDTSILLDYTLTTILNV